MKQTDNVTLLVKIPRDMRRRLRVAAAARELTITTVVSRAIESTLATPNGTNDHAEA